MVVYTQSFAETDTWTVNIIQGPVKGYKPSGWDLFEFHGIPYATAPTGQDRFKAPLPAPTWEKTFEAVEKNIICPQSSNSIANVIDAKVRENCLISTLYVPHTNKTNLPVLVFVHGGAFQNGFADRSSARNLVQSKDIIVAMFNYRLGAHGFLCLGTENAPGNAGIKDQVAYLRWVQENIAYFGGNPDDVTVYGNSAGGRAVDLLAISHVTEGLFKAMIADSGITLGASTVQVNPIENAKTFANLLNYTGSYDIRSLEQFYLNASYDLLTSVDTTRLVDFLFSPCIEKNVGQEIFLEESPFETLKRGDFRKIPILYGYTEFEGTFRLGVFGQWQDSLIKNLPDFLPHDLQFPTEEEKLNIAQKVKSYYFGNEEVISNENILLFIDYFTDTMYVYPMLRAIKLQLEAGHENIYLYEYSFVSEESPMMPFINKQGAFHSAQTGVILDSNDETNISTELKNMKSIMRDMWYDFITSGAPVPEGSSTAEWPAAKLNNIKLMSLNQTITLERLQHRSLFWEDIYDKYYLNPIAPSADAE
ncbi:para-nitrobenzyl esterase-like [Zerene cesonia]|uniref:para-nitrobenzyl esterase-like n=1 Tax=Zerene cesonia TaxID=33412 RepID=UPI0018E50EC7|nr:para-nitrobenzyl esterase-like [Zerene cesonia]